MKIGDVVRVVSRALGENWYMQLGVIIDEGRHYTGESVLARSATFLVRSITTGDAVWWFSSQLQEAPDEDR